MNDDQQLIKVQQNLTAILNLVEQLATEAIHQANNPLMPGGLAMVALAGAASPGRYETNIAELETAAITFARETGLPLKTLWPETYDDPNGWEPPLQTLRYWSEQWRTIHGYPKPKPSIHSEVVFVRWALNWAQENEPHFAAFIEDIHDTRSRLENTLKAGTRADRSRVICPTCDDPHRLIRIWGDNTNDDAWKCPNCKNKLTEDDHQRAYAKQLRHAGAMRFIPKTDALAVMKSQGRSARTVRKWFEDCTIETRCNIQTRTTEVWWPDLWRQHLATPTRRRAAA